MKEGGILLSVHADNADWTKRAKEILERTGAEDISVTGEGGADYVRSERPPERPTTGGGESVAVRERRVHRVMRCGAAALVRRKEVGAMDNRVDRSACVVLARGWGLGLLAVARVARRAR